MANIENIRARDDGTYVVDLNGLPYHVTQDAPELFQEVVSLVESKEVSVGEDHGHKFVVDPVAEARLWRDAELARADIELLKAEDKMPGSKGTPKQWRTYRVELRSWPETENFPTTESRPVAPDAE